MRLKSLSSEASVVDAVNRLQRHSGFTEWCAEEEPQQGDLLLINNSFVFRDVQTAKASLYLCAEFDSSKTLKTPPRVATLSATQNVDFRRLSLHQSHPKCEDLGAVVSREKRLLGHLVFALIAVISDDRVVDVPLSAGPVKRLVWDPRQSAPLTLTGDTVTIHSVDNEVTLWEALQQELSDRGTDTAGSLKQEFAKALDALQGMARASLRLPDGRRSLTDGVLDNILKALRDHHSGYNTALGKYKRAQTEESKNAQFNEMLRISYAFATESAGLLRLVVSVCDLKPLVLWATIDKHYALSEGLRQLPWVRSKNKPSLQNYLAMVGDARNHAFHNVFPFTKALHFELPPSALSGAELRMFSEFGSKSHGNELTFHDKALADVMLSFTRARRRPTPDIFWTKNSDVMGAMIDLFSATNTILKQLYEEVKHGPG